MSHRNYVDLSILESVADGMQVVGKVDKSMFECRKCIEGKTINCRNRNGTH